ncbi:ankyrin repeat-containing domain protein [Boletus coccyginus]|nr:ankyrin repeat-containing domain protein [Boletus coccyginus]
MELAKRIILEIESTSQGVISAATEYASHRGLRNVQSCHFRLEKEMQGISVAARGILDVLSKSSLPDGPPLDDRLQDWFSTDELPKCLDTLNQMKGMLQNNTCTNMIFSFVTNMLYSSPPEDKVDAVVKFFDSRRDYFHLLLTTDVWNCEESQQQPRALPASAQAWPAFEVVPELNIDLSGISSFGAADRPTIVEEGEGREMDDSRRLDDILRWLSGLSCAAKQEETFLLRQPDTCTWLDSTPEYESWRNCDSSSLWLQGKPGSGKTVLASFVVNSLKNKLRSGEALAFFYCDFRNDRSTSTAEVMRSLLSQLLRHTHNENIGLGELLDDLVRDMDGDMPTLKNAKRLTTFISRTARYFNYQPLIVVDALDECKDVENLLDGLFSLVKGGVRLFITSRPLQIIKDALRGLRYILMDKMTSAMSADIALHVTRELDSRRRLRDLEVGFKAEIRSILCDRADCMFRWVQCQIDTLNQCATKTEVREALDNLPIGLDETYQRILIAIDPGLPEGKLALRALVWLVGALRPLRLAEISEGLTIDLGKRTMDPEAGPMHKGALLDACGSLVTYNEETDVLILSHFSVKEYLTGDLTRTKLPRYHISYQGAHEHLARLCICYITLYLRHAHGSGDETPLSHIMRTIEGRPRNAAGQWSRFSGSTPAVCSVSQELLGYVFTNGFSHLAYLGSANHVVLNDMMALRLDIERYSDAWEVIYQMSHHHKPPIPWPTRKHDFMHYVLIAFSSASLFLAFLRRHCNVLEPRDQTNPLVYAAHFGKAQHAQMLLSRGAKVNERGLVVDASHQALPFEIAVWRRHDAVIDLLLFAGCVVPRRLFALSTYYYKFPVHVVRRLLETDQFVEWATEPKSELPSPLRILEHRPPLAYEADIIFIIRRLVQVGVDPAEHDSAHRTALYFAILGGYQAVVVYLLLIGAPFPPDFISVVSRTTSSERIPMLRLIVEAGADIHARAGGDESGDTTLHLAIRFFLNDCLEAVKILVGAGCDPFARNAADKTPLHLALEKGNLSVADYLLSQGTPRLDALLAVVESSCSSTWRLEALRALVNRGADIDALLPREMMSLETPNTSGETPLRLVMGRNLSLADHLLSTGRCPPPDTLFAVLQSDLPTSWKTLTICSLLGEGANVRGLSADGNTLLYATVLALDEHQGLDMAQLLVGAGCDPFARSADGKTALHIALDRNFPRIANFLLSSGKPLPPDALFAVLHCALPVAWRAQAIHSLVGEGVDVRGVSADGNTLLHATVLSLYSSQALDVAKLLVNAGCDPSVCNRQGKTALHIAVEEGRISVMEYILSLNQPLPDDILFSVVKSPCSNQVHVLRMLLNKGANTSVVAVDGNNLLHVAISSLPTTNRTSVVETLGLDVVRLLVVAGCDPSACSADGKTPLHIALDRELPGIADYLLSTGNRFLPMLCLL